MLDNYKSFEEKKTILQLNCENGLNGHEIIDTIEDFDKITNILEQGNYIYRGINEAKFKCYSSAQRNKICNLSFWNKINLNDPKYDEYLDALKIYLYERGILGDNLPDIMHKAIRICINELRSNDRFRMFFSERDIILTDFFIMSVMQHFVNFSPLLDFSLSLNKALFFATYNSKINGSEMIDNYISLYYIRKDIDWIEATLQKVNKEAAFNADKMLNEEIKKGVNVSYKDFWQKTSGLLFEEYIGGPDFICVEGPEGGITSVNMPKMGLSCEYDMRQPRINCQDGLFIFNYDEKIPLWEKINNGKDSTRNFIRCIEINKELIPYIKEKRLDPNNINYQTVYYPDESSRELEEIVNEVFS